MNLALPEIDQPIRLHFDCPMTDEELMQMISNSPQGNAVLRQREAAPTPDPLITADDEDLLR